MTFNNNNQVLVQTLWAQTWILIRLVRVGHMYSIPPFYSFFLFSFFDKKDVYIKSYLMQIRIKYKQGEN